MHSWSGVMKETTMATYSGDVIASTNEDFPFMAVVTDEKGTVVVELLARTEADGEAKVMEALRELKEREAKGK